MQQQTAVVAAADVNTTSSSSAISTSHLCSSHLYRNRLFVVEFDEVINSAPSHVRCQYLHSSYATVNPWSSVKI